MSLRDIGKRVAEARRSKGMSQTDLAAESGVGQSTIDRIEKGQGKRPSASLPAVSRVLGLNIDALLGTTSDAGSATLRMRPKLNLGDRDLPVHAATQGGEGVLIVSSDPVDYVRRPGPLEQVKDGYGVIVVGESMRPELRAGDIALVHPHLPPVREEACVFYADNGAGEVKATIKSFVRETTTHWHVEQWNPAKKFTLAKAEWQKCHRVVGKYSRR